MKALQNRTNYEPLKRVDLKCEATVYDVALLVPRTRPLEALGKLQDENTSMKLLADQPDLQLILSAHQALHKNQVLFSLRGGMS